jgi:hypothetical protein
MFHDHLHNPAASDSQPAEGEIGFTARLVNQEQPDVALHLPPPWEPANKHVVIPNFPPNASETRGLDRIIRSTPR